MLYLRLVMPEMSAVRYLRTIDTVSRKNKTTHRCTKSAWRETACRFALHNITKVLYDHFPAREGFFVAVRFDNSPIRFDA